MPKKFTDAQLDELLAKGYLIVRNYYSGEQLAEMQAGPTPCPPDLGGS